jgi:Domain of unknown function (DUF305)
MYAAAYDACSSSTRAELWAKTTDGRTLDSMPLSLKQVVRGGVLALVLLSGRLMNPGIGGEANKQSGSVALGAEDANSFHELMSSSMERMHRDMIVPPSGNVDRDFALMMIPHHQGAVDMAKAEIMYGRNKVLRRLAEGIIIEQQQEIEVMRAALSKIDGARGRELNSDPQKEERPHLHTPEETAR